jgi:hypothetical protein
VVPSEQVNVGFDPVMHLPVCELNTLPSEQVGVGSTGVVVSHLLVSKISKLCEGQPVVGFDVGEVVSHWLVCVFKTLPSEQVGVDADIPTTLSH